MQFQSRSFGWVICWCSLRVSNADQSANEIKIFELETIVKSKLSQTFSAFNQRRCSQEPVLEFEDACIEKEEEQDV